MGVLPELEGSRHVEPAGDPVRRLGRAAGAVGGLPRAARPADPAGVGDDRDEPGRLGRAHQVDARDRLGRRDGRPAHARSAPIVARRRASASSSPGRSTPLPWDGESSGELQVRGPWIASAYYNDERSGESFTEDGWLQDRRRRHDRRATATSGSSTAPRTSSSPAASGSARSSSRTSSWATPRSPRPRSSASPHPKWAERPLACVVVKPGEELTKEEVLDFLGAEGGQVAAARRRRVHRRGAEDLRRQVLEEGPARPLRRLLPARLTPDLCGTVERPTARKRQRV